MTTDLAVQLFGPSALLRTHFVARSLPRPQPRAQRTVLDVSEFFGETSGGVRTYLTEKARFVERSSTLRQSIVVPGPRDAITESARVRCYRVGSFPVPGQPPYRFLLDRAASAMILAHERPDIIEVGSSGLAPWHVLNTRRRFDIPLVSFFHSDIASVVGGARQPRTLAGRARASLAWRYIRYMDQRFSRTIVSSRYAANQLATHGIGRTAYIPLGVDLRQFHPAHRSRGLEQLAQLGIDERPIAMFVGRFSQEKRLELLLAAWPRVAARTGAQLVLIGDGPLRRRLLAIYAHPSIRWLGYMNRRVDVARLLAAADVVVSPCECETFGLAAVEALASGTPVLSADGGGAAELITDSGGGMLFPSGDSHGLAEQLERLLLSPSVARRERGRAHAERRHRWDDVFASLFAIYDDVLSGSQ